MKLFDYYFDVGDIITLLISGCLTIAFVAFILVVLYYVIFRHM